MNKKTKFKTLSLVCLVSLSFIGTNAYSFTEEAAAKTYDTLVCTQKNSDGSTTTWSACAVPKTNGPCDKVKSCN